MSNSDLLSSLSSLATEARNTNTTDLDTLNSLELVSRINEQDKLVADAITKELPVIAEAVDAISNAFSIGGRLLYVGAGTSGRLGILDASECAPTFGVSESMVIGLIAGGHKAMFKAQEGAEDSPQQGKEDLVQHNVNSKDVVVGIAASGRTPYVVGALQYAKSVAGHTVALSCNPDSVIAKHADIAITPIVGPEVLTGSTRMKAGTAQKLVLNMLTTASMVRIGKCFENLMVDVQVSNEKLLARAIGIVMQATDCSKEEASNVLQQSQHNVKAAILMKLTGLGYEQAKQTLQASSGYLRRALNSHNARG